MLSIPTYKLPRKVAIRVSKAEKLIPSEKNNKKKLNNKYRAVILGGKKKEASDLVLDSQGNPSWNFTSIIKLHRGNPDPVCILIEDSEGHHKGQVVIPLVKLTPKPYTHSEDQSPATSNNLICSELEPTSKVRAASGFLFYWIWVEEYYADGDTDSRGSFKKSMSSLFGSKNALSIKGSKGNVGSTSSLNKPESHKGSHGFLNIKSKKDKSKLSSSDFKGYTNPGDTEFHVDPGNPFDTNKSSQNNKNLSYGSNDLQFGVHANPFIGDDERSMTTKTYNPLPDRLDMLTHSNQGSVSSMKFGDESSGTRKQGSGTIDQRYLPGNMSMSSNDFSIISDRSVNPPVSTTIKTMNDEANALRRENADLRSQNDTMSHKISLLQSELDEVKDTLFKLRSKLLEHGAMKFLEKM